VIGPGRLTEMLGALNSCSPFLGDVTVCRVETGGGGGDFNLGEIDQCGVESPDRGSGAFSGLGISAGDSTAGGGKCGFAADKAL
jgi:hypothetical protein